MQPFYFGNSLLGDELAIAQQLTSDILTCFGADVLDRAPLAVEAPIGEPLAAPMGGKKFPIEGPIKATHRG